MRAGRCSSCPGSRVTWGSSAGRSLAGIAEIVPATPPVALASVVTPHPTPRRRRSILVNPRASRLTRPGAARPDRRRPSSAPSATRTGRAPRVEAGSLEAHARGAARRRPRRRSWSSSAATARVREAADGAGRPRDAAGDRPGRDRQRPGRRARDPRRRPGARRHPPRPARVGSTSGGPAGDARGRTIRPTPPRAERIFTVACGMGLDARIMAAAEHEWKRRLRFGAYVGAAVRELVRLESARFRIVADGETLEIEGYLVLVANAGELVPGRIGPRQPIDPSTAGSSSSSSAAPTRSAALRGAAELMLRSGELGGGRHPALRQRGPDRGRARPADRDRRRPPPRRLASRRGSCRARSPILVPGG